MRDFIIIITNFILICFSIYILIKYDTNKPPQVKVIADTTINIKLWNIYKFRDTIKIKGIYHNKIIYINLILPKRKQK